MSTRRFIGIDSGKSATRVLATDDEGHVLWQGESGGFAYTSESGADLDDLVAAVRAAAGSLGDDVPTRLCAGLTGLPGHDADREVLKVTLAAMFSARVVLVDDVVTAHAGALARPGTVLSAGTGSVAIAVAADGRWARRDGWGPAVGDRGSAHDIGQSALRAAAAAADRTGMTTSMGDEIFAALGGADLEALQRLHRRPDRVAFVSGLARIVARHAEHGDEVARSICDSAGTDLAATAIAAAQAVGVDSEAPSVSYAGRLLTGAGPVRRAFHAALDAAGLELTPPAGDSLSGAVTLARSDEPGIYAGLMARQGTAA
ncbi:N-acetylglucosamine kinase [Knoellia sp. CPCC 206453]|uniref:N-acetylglucosamine kinase n=1 Tax=Knoellia pratensis TaxID=3404796 RepID=UPI003623EA45